MTATVHTGPTGPDTRVAGVLARAARRWTTARDEVPVDPDLLAALAAAVQPLLHDQPDTDTAARLEEITAQRDQLAAEVDALRRAQDEVVAAQASDRDQLAAAQDALAAAASGQDDRQERHQRTVATLQARISGLTEQRDTARLDRVSMLRLLDRLVETVTEQHLPVVEPGRGEVLEAAVDRAVLLVQAAAANLRRREAAGEHLHTFSLTPCTGCGEEYRPAPGSR